MKFWNGKPERFALAFRSGLSLHLHGDKVERPCPAPDTADECRVPRPNPRSRARRPAAVTRRKIAMAVEIHHRIGDLLRAVPSIEIEHLVVLAAAVLAIGPKPKQDIGLLAGHMILEEFGRASAIEDGAVQEVAAFGFDASSCACALPAKG